jgi:hypothetical protein
MIFSKQQQVSDDQAITATALSTNVIDLLAAGIPYSAAAALNNDKGKGTQVPFLIQLTEAFNTLTSLTFTIEVSANSDMSSSTVVYSSGAVPLASLVVGYQVPVKNLPAGINKRYLAVRYTVTGTAPTTGKVTAGIVMGVQTNVTGA